MNLLYRKMELLLNPYVKNVAENFLKPLLRENGCEKLQPKLNSWMFNPAKTPKTGDWEKLTSHNVEDILESQERATLPINGKLKLCEGVICLELLMKFIELRLNIEDSEIEDTENTYKICTQDMVLIDAATNPTQVAYYSSILEIGQCTRTTLTNRAKNITLELGVNLQDLRFHMSSNNILRLFRNNRGKLTYIPEELYKSNVKRIARQNKEVKINGQGENTKMGTYTDPREIPNNTELNSEYGRPQQEESQ